MTSSLKAVDQLLSYVDSAIIAGDSNNNNSNRITCIEILGLGNPLLDISSPVDIGFMQKYNVRPNNAILAEASHLPMYEELSNMKTVEYIAGGSTLNSVRVAEWMIPGKNRVGYMGCIGNDPFGDRLKNSANSAGVDCHFMTQKKCGTGTCAVCILDKERSLVANLSAANEFTIEHMNTDKAKAMLKSAKIVYNAGFFVTVSPETMLMCAEQCKKDCKVYAINFSAEFVVKFFQKQVLELLPLVTLIFANKDEALAFAEANKIEYGNDMKCLAQKISDYASVRNDTLRTVIITQGKDAVLVATQGKDFADVREYAVPPIPDGNIVDVNGAGDAFVGGYLSQLIQGKDEKVCVAAGNYCAGYILQRSGTTLSGKPSFGQS